MCNNKFRRQRSLDRQSGIAGVELVLFLPIFLILMVASIHVTRVMHLKLEVLVDARNAATLPDFYVHIPTFSRYGVPKLHSAKKTKPESNSWDVVETMRQGGKSDYNNVGGLTQVLNGSPIRLSQGATQTLYKTHPSLPGGFVLIKEKHGLLRDSKWLREQMPLGYDNYLHSRLRPKKLYGNFFPCRTGDLASAKKAKGCK
ncbi:MAG: hypothetical protein ACI9B9_000384 [Halioglobus sp.]|jgi:hypothetical protein